MNLRKIISVNKVSPDFIMSPKLNLISASGWKDYELFDSGDGRKLERYGKYISQPSRTGSIVDEGLPEKIWQEADAVYYLGDGQNSGSWQKKPKIPTQWKISYRNLKFILQLCSSRHIGVFPEQAAQWDWINERLISAKIQLRFSICLDILLLLPWRLPRREPK